MIISARPSPLTSPAPLTNLSREKVQYLIEHAKASVNGRLITNNSFKITAGDVISFTVTTTNEVPLEPADIHFEVVFEDEYLAVINKPAGLSVHGGAGIHVPTLVNGLAKRFAGQLSNIGDYARPGIVHRLDKDTSGLLLIAKDNATHLALSQMIKDREVTRVYQALCYGKFAKDIGTINTFIDRSKNDRRRMSITRKSGRSAITHYQVIEVISDQLSLVELRLDTGRTHQIRAHLEHIKHPVVGDQVYGRSLNFKLSNLTHKQQKLLKAFPRQALQAKELRFTHPVTALEMAFKSDFADDIKELIAQLATA